MNVSEELGVAVVGLGIGQQHLNTYLRSKECLVRWVFDREINRPALADSLFGDHLLFDFTFSAMCFLIRS